MIRLVCLVIVATFIFGVTYAQQPAVVPHNISWKAVERGLTYEPAILEAANKYQIDARYIWIVGYLETKFKPRAVSWVGAQGLMQFMPTTARRMGVADTFNPYQSIDGGARYLKFLYSKFGHPASMLAGYNAGEQAVDCFLKGYSVTLPSGKVINSKKIKTPFGVPPYRETQHYVAEGMRLLSLMKPVGGEVVASAEANTEEVKAAPKKSTITRDKKVVASVGQPQKVKSLKVNMPADSVTDESKEVVPVKRKAHVFQ